MGSKPHTGGLKRCTDSHDMDAVLRAYERLAPLYDFFFGKTLDRGRRLAVRATNGRARRVLEVGVGTGISLPCYRRDHEVTGVDISPKMLERLLVSICDFLGWRIDFCLDEIIFRTSLSLLKIQAVGPFGLYTLLQLRK